MRRLGRLITEARTLAELSDLESYADTMSGYAHQRAKDGAGSIKASELTDYLWDDLMNRGIDLRGIDRKTSAKVEREAKKIAREVTKLIKQGFYQR